MLLKSIQIIMIENIKGIIEKKTPAFVVMDVNGIGMKILMSINGLESVPPKGNDALILTYLHVREDMLDLYGFVTLSLTVTSLVNNSFPAANNGTPVQVTCLKTFHLPGEFAVVLECIN